MSYVSNLDNKGKYVILRMANKSTFWIRRDTQQFMTIIYEWLHDKYVNKKSSYKKYYSFNQISRHTGIDIKTVRTSLINLAFREDPKIQIIADIIPCTNGYNTVHKVYYCPDGITRTRKSTNLEKLRKPRKKTGLIEENEFSD